MEQKIYQAEQLFETGEVLEAKTIFEEILVSGPNSRVFNNLGVIAFNENDPNLAVNYFIKAINADPKNNNALANLCDMLEAGDNLGEALGLLQTLHKKYPQDLEVKNWLKKAEQKKKI